MTHIFTILLSCLRWKAKEQKNFAAADFLKKEIQERGFETQDKKDSFNLMKL